MNIPENQYKVSLKWLYHLGEEFHLTITEVMKGKKKQGSIMYVLRLYFPRCVILFMVNLN